MRYFLEHMQQKHKNTHIFNQQTPKENRKTKTD